MKKYYYLYFNELATTISLNLYNLNLHFEDLVLLNVDYKHLGL